MKYKYLKIRIYTERQRTDNRARGCRQTKNDMLRQHWLAVLCAHTT